MSDQFLSSLSEEEANQFEAGIEALQQKIRQQREEARLKPLIEAYRRDMLAAPRGTAGNGARAEIRERAIRNGVPVDQVDFTGAV